MHNSDHTPTPCASTEIKAKGMVKIFDIENAADLGVFTESLMSVEYDSNGVPLSIFIEGCAIPVLLK
jgi:hypothetical protein